MKCKILNRVFIKFYMGICPAPYFMVSKPWHISFSYFFTINNSTISNVECLFHCFDSARSWNAWLG